jgi:hypothetical protein
MPLAGFVAIFPALAARPSVIRSTFTASCARHELGAASTIASTSARVIVFRGRRPRVGSMYNRQSSS